MYYIIDKLILINEETILYDNYLYKNIVFGSDIEKFFGKCKLALVFIDNNLNFNREMYDKRKFISYKNIKFINDTFYINNEGIFSFKNAPGKNVNLILINIKGINMLFEKSNKSYVRYVIKNNDIILNNRKTIKLNEIIIYDNKKIYNISEYKNFINMIHHIIYNKCPIIIYKIKSKLIFMKSGRKKYYNSFLKCTENILYHNKKFIYHNDNSNLIIDNYYLGYKYLKNFNTILFILLTGFKIKITSIIFNNFINGKIWDYNNMGLIMLKNLNKLNDIKIIHR